MKNLNPEIGKQGNLMSFQKSILLCDLGEKKEVQTQILQNLFDKLDIRNHLLHKKDNNYYLLKIKTLS